MSACRQQTAAIAELRRYVVIAPSLAALSERLGLKRVVPLAVERGVQVGVRALYLPAAFLVCCCF